jgi:hypothetical protein
MHNACGYPIHWLDAAANLTKTLEHSQTVCDMKFSRKKASDFGLLKCDPSQFGILAPTFRSNLLPPPSILKTEAAESSALLAISY